MKRIMIAAMQSGSGKTTVTCGLLAALKNRKISVQAFKCGPDYIDPMFHTRVLGIPSRNLDLFLQGEAGVRKTLSKQSAEIAVLEGAMGYYDGLGGTERASAYEVAKLTDTPVILVVRPKGSSLTLAAQIKGLCDFRDNSKLVGVVFSDCKPMLYSHLRPIIERETPLRVLGYLPPMEDASVASRHLGLLTAAEVDNFAERYDAIAAQLEKTIDIDGILALAGETESSPAETEYTAPRCKIAVARDEACCFYYEDNFDALREAGAEIEFFSPMRDAVLPECDGLYLGGGYPELYTKELSENTAMRESIAAAVKDGLPTVAECGGYLYLCRSLEGADGVVYPMVVVIPTESFKTDRLQRFGYAELTAKSDSLLMRTGEKLPIHEFHCWDCRENGEAFTAKKPLSEREWQCGYVSETIYAAFPHLHFGGELPLAERFVKAAIKYREKKNA